MPTPIGHSLAGLAVYIAAPSRHPENGARDERRRRGWWLAAFLVVIANLPDVDFIPGYLVGEPRAFHWGATHSLMAALVAATVAGVVAQRLGQSFRLFFALTATAYASHIAMDLLLGPGAHSVGLQVLWPFSLERFMAPWQVFLMFPSSIHETGPIGALFSRGVLPLIQRELLVFGPVCAAAWLATRGRRVRETEPPDRL
jgi:inner membrane protein